MIYFAEVNVEEGLVQAFSGTGMKELIATLRALFCASGMIRGYGKKIGEGWLICWDCWNTVGRWLCLARGSSRDSSLDLYVADELMALLYILRGEPSKCLV